MQPTPKGPYNLPEMTPKHCQLWSPKPKKNSIQFKPQMHRHYLFIQAKSGLFRLGKGLSWGIWSFCLNNDKWPDHRSTDKTFHSPLSSPLLHGSPRWGTRQHHCRTGSVGSAPLMAIIRKGDNGWGMCLHKVNLGFNYWRHIWLPKLHQKWSLPWAWR